MVTDCWIIFKRGGEELRYSEADKVKGGVEMQETAF